MKRLFNNLIFLPGKSYLVTTMPERCLGCGCKEFYRQSDFRRSTGVTLVSIASLSTFVLMALGYNWWTVWSPMFLFLFFDRVVYRILPWAAICYDCETKFRGLDKRALESIETFDLKTHDRFRYPERVHSDAVEQPVLPGP